jgi:alkylation response protein AidB-like acyl-CoA dehydrogenase
MNKDPRADRWLDPLRAGITELTRPDLARLSEAEDTLLDLLAVYPIGWDISVEARSRHLRRIRQELAARGLLALAVPARHGGYGHAAVLQVLLQFTCGYHDVDLRDSTGLGHGRLIAEHAMPQARDLWLPRLLAGAVPGIAITEAHGGSQVHATRTSAQPGTDGSWLVTGTKTWISRLNEAAVFGVFFTSPDGQFTAAVIDAQDPGLTRRPLVPSGLSGWAWGELCLRDLVIRPANILGEPGAGMRLLREHFTHYRPLVAATALGAAAAVHDQTATLLASRRRAGTITRVRDNALITLGRTHAQINAALLAAITAYRLAEADHPSAHAWGCAVKAHGADIAYQAASELALLAGASGFVAGSRTAKARRDLNALLYADGIHDSLYRSAGYALIPLGHAIPQLAVPQQRMTPEQGRQAHA